MTIKCKCGFTTIFSMDLLPRRHKCRGCKAILMVRDREEENKKVLKVKRK
jgi:hypothetical protein